MMNKTVIPAAMLSFKPILAFFRTFFGGTMIGGGAVCVIIGGANSGGTDIGCTDSGGIMGGANSDETGIGCIMGGANSGGIDPSGLGSGGVSIGRTGSGESATDEIGSNGADSGESTVDGVGSGCGGSIVSSTASLSICSRSCSCISPQLPITSVSFSVRV